MNSSHPLVLLSLHILSLSSVSGLGNLTADTPMFLHFSLPTVIELALLLAMPDNTERLEHSQ